MGEHGCDEYLRLGISAVTESYGTRGWRENTAAHISCGEYGFRGWSCRHIWLQGLVTGCRGWGSRLEDSSGKNIMRGTLSSVSISAVTHVRPGSTSEHMCLFTTVTNLIRMK